MAVLAPFLIEAVGILRADSGWLVVGTPDDAFYYLEIARRIDRGQGFTFDGVHATNGFHPLWQLVLAGVGPLVTSPTDFVRTSLLLGLACLLGATLLVIRLVWRWLGAGPALLGGIVVAHGRAAMPSYVDGMEGALTLLVLALLATALVWFFTHPEPRRAVVVGLLCALTVFARLDMTAVIWIVPVAMVVRTRRRALAGWWLLGGAAGLPWAVWFWLRYHHVLTTSATVKQHEISALAKPDGGRLSWGYARYVLSTANTYVRMLLGSANDTLLRGHGLVGWLSGLAITVLALIGLASRRWGRRPPPASADTPSGTPVETGAGATAWALGALGLMVAAKAVVDLINEPIWAPTWYSVPQRFALTFAAGAAAWLGARWVLARWRRVGAVVMVYLCFAALPVSTAAATQSATYPRFASSWQDDIAAAATWIDQHGPPGRYAPATPACWAIASTADAPWSTWTAWSTTTASVRCSTAGRATSSCSRPPVSTTS